MIDAIADAHSLDDTLAALGEPLLLLLLERAVNTSADLERLLRQVRAALLADATEHPGRAVDQTQGRVLSALAQQGFLNEYAWYESPPETAGVSALVERIDVALATQRTILSRELAIVGAYRPLDALPFAPRVLRYYAPDAGDWLYDVIRLQLIGPLQDRAHGAAVNSVSPVEDETARRVREQYEQHPYPRWLHLDQHDAQSVPDYLASALHGFDGDLQNVAQAPSILVAGCGTGKQAISAARRFAGSRVLALDLSRTSLAYATRMAAELGVTNVSFGHGDLQSLADDVGPFDIIECVGVLHHLASPDKGLGALVDRLGGGGLMRIGLYSRRARQVLDPARRLAKAQGWSADLPGIRAFRHHVLSVSPDDPLAGILSAADFYSTSECRDLVFHVCEHEFTLEQVEGLLARHGLNFLGFELGNDAAIAAYAEAFPGDPKQRSLANWSEMETRYPGIFAAMYQFWAVKR